MYRYTPRWYFGKQLMHIAVQKIYELVLKQKKSIDEDPNTIDFRNISLP